MRLLHRTILLMFLSIPGSLSYAQAVKVDEPAVCYACHAEFSELKGKISIHTPLKNGTCSGCHNPHASEHAALLAKDESELCFKCHEDISRKVKLSSPHRPALEGQCLQCHEAHFSDFAKQLKDKASTLCANCHPTVNTWWQDARVHRPVSQKNCMVCHDAHGSESDNLLSRKIPDLCLGCHNPSTLMGTSHRNFDVVHSNCMACHDPHSSSLKGLVRANQHAPFMKGQCKLCHESASGKMRLTVEKEIKPLCLSCHKDLASTSELKYHHIMDDDQSCLNCHNPHTSKTDKLLSAGQQDLCQRCHFTDIPQDQKAGYLTHNGRDCSVCHSPHGSNESKYLKSTALELCSGCHPGSQFHLHPIGPNVLDPKTGASLSCLGCHKLHGAKFPKYLPLDPDRELCIQCHPK